MAAKGRAMDNDLGEIVDALPGLVWAARPDGTLEFLNTRWVEYTGYPLEETAAGGWPSVIHTEDLENFEATWHAIRASDKSGKMEVRLRRSDGTYRWFLVVASPRVDADGQLKRWYGINTDIEDRKRIEEALRASEQQLRLIVDGLPALVSFMTPEGKLARANRHYLEYFGAPIEELKERGVLHSFHPEDRPRVLSVRANSLAHGQPYEAEGRRRGADGEYRWFRLNALPLRDSEDRIVLWHLLQTDIDDQKHAQALLSGEKRLLEMVATGQPLATTLNELCLLVQELCTSCSCSSILLLDAGTQKLWHAASPSVPKAYIESIDGFSIGPDVSSCGTAAFQGSQVVASDISIDPRWVSFRDVALNNALRACWSTPIFSQQNRVLGTFAMFSSKPGEPSVRDQAVIAQLTHLASIAIEREQSRKSLKTAFDELRISEGRLKTIIDAIPTIAWHTSADGSGEFLNQRWHDYAGISRSEANRSIIHPKDEKALAETWRNSLATSGRGEVEVRMRRHDGVYRWHLSRFEPFLDESGQITAWYGADTDIDDAKRAEALLAGEKGLLELVARGQALTAILAALCTLVEHTIEGSFSSVVLVDPSGTRLEHGAAPSLPPSFIDSLVGRPVNSDSGPCAMAAYLNEQVISADFTTETRWSDYHWVPMALTHGLRACWSTPIPSTAGKPLGAFAIYYEERREPTPQDQSLIAQITHIASIAIERAQNHEALTRSEAFLKKAQRLSASGSFSWRVATDELMFSEEYYRIFDLDPAKPVTVAMVMARVHPEDAPTLTRMIERARREGTDFDYEHRLVMLDGTVKYIYMVAHRADDPDGQSVYIGAVQDVTRRRLSEDALGKVRSELARVARVTSLGALTASIAHEVNQPLFSITTNASTCVRMLGGEPPNLEGAREMARRIIRDGNRASEVITRLRAMFVKRDPTTESVDLNEATKEVIALSIGEMQRAQVILHTDFAEDLPQITGDRVQLQQVILNLCLNAADAMSGVEDRPRQLVIRTELEGGERVRLSVEDTGVGFEPERAETLFDAFYTTKHGGMGIGLSVSRAIIEGHHGHLWAAPKNGPGATFAFSVPFAPLAGSIVSHTTHRQASEPNLRNA
jgi:PAS domain S-box-containing protein